MENAFIRLDKRTLMNFDFSQKANKKYKRIDEGSVLASLLLVLVFMLSICHVLDRDTKTCTEQNVDENLFKIFIHSN